AGETNARTRASIKAIEICFGKCARDLTGAVCAEVEENHAVAILNGPNRLIIVADHDNRFDELIRHAFAIGFSYGRDRVTARAAFPVTKQPVSLLGALPPFVSVHSVVTAYDRRDAPRPVIFHSFNNLRDIARPV